MTGVLIAPHSADQLSAQLIEIPDLKIRRTFTSYPTEKELIRCVQLTGPSIVFLSTEDPRRAIDLAHAVDRSGVGTQIVAVNSTIDPHVLVEFMQAGIREFLTLPLDLVKLADAVTRSADVLVRKPLAFHSTDAVFSFLPAKPGDGTSTVALNVSSAMARQSKRRTLIVDFDLNLGMVSFLLKITAGRSVLDAIQFADNLDDKIWDDLVMKREGVEVLSSGRLDPGNTLHPDSALDVLYFARRSYGNIFLDLSGNMEPFSVELLRNSREVFVVCTPEVPSLHFARTKIEFLRHCGIQDRVSVLLNRSDKRSLFPISDVERMLGARVRFSFTTDARRVSEAMTAGTCIDPKSDLGKQFDAFAKSLTPGEGGAAFEPQNQAKRRFIEFFAVVPSTYHVDSEKRR